MSNLRSNSRLIFLLLPLFFFFFPLSYGSSLRDLHDIRIGSGFHDERIPNKVVVAEWNTRRRITAEITNGPTNGPTYIILAANRTHRRDPSVNFDFYTGGWNITNPHYLYSLAYSANGPIIVAVVWFVMFGLFLLCICISRCCCRKKIYGYSRTAYVLSVVFLSIATLAAVGGIIYIYVDQAKFTESIVQIASAVLKKAHSVVLKLKRLMDTLLDAKDAGFDDIPIPADIQTHINEAETQINTVSDRLANVTRENSKEIRSFLNPLRVTIICVATVMLVLVILGFLFSILGLKFLVYCLIFVGWILITTTFILSGVFLLLHNLVTDTCVAMDEWLQNPTANSALERIIPKVDSTITQDITSVTKTATFGLLSMVNGEIANVSNAHLGLEAGALYYNQTGPYLPLVCNPYHPNLTDSPCEPGAVSFNNASQIWRAYVCQISASGICTTEGRLTPRKYTQMTAAVNISSVLYTGMPFILELINSTYLQETFSDISKDHCPDLEIYTRGMYIVFSSSSATVVLSMILWVLFARERKHRATTRESSGIPLSN